MAFKMTHQASGIGDPVPNTSSRKKSKTNTSLEGKFKKFTSLPINSSDTVHVNTTAGHKIVVGKGSPYHKQSQRIGAVVSQHRPGGNNLNESTDPLAIKNYNKRYENNK